MVFSVIHSIYLKLSWSAIPQSTTSLNRYLNNIMSISSVQKGSKYKIYIGGVTMFWAYKLLRIR
jgi:hypothetical protein